MKQLAVIAGMLFLSQNGLAQIGKIVLDSPANGATNQVISPSLSWYTDAVARYYRIQLSADSSFASARIDTTVVGDTTQSKQAITAGPLGNDTVYYWHVRGASASTGGTTGSWSTTYSFRTIPALPSAPTLLSPATASTSLPLTDTLKWGAVSTADSYRIQISTSSSFSSYIMDSLQSSLTGLQTQYVVVTGLANGTTYYWRVYSHNAAGQSTSASSIWNFTTIVAPPGSPTLTAPTAGATSQDTASTAFTWSTTSPASTTYRLQIASDSLFASLVCNDSTISTATKTISSTLLTNSTYYWRVRGKNAGGTGSYSSTRSFSTILRTPQISSPTSGSTNLGQPVMLDWTSVPGAATYKVQVSANYAFSSYVVNTTAAVDSQTVSGLTSNTTYYWRVNAVGSAGDTSKFSSTVWNFKTMPAIPPAPSLTAPAAGAMSQSTTSLAFSWGTATDAVSYHIQIATDSTFGTSSIAVEDSALSATTKTVTSGLNPAAVYYWRVSAKNSAGIGPYSVIRSFSTALTQPAIVSPASAAQNQPIALTLDWGTVSSAFSYRVQVSTSSAFSTSLTDQILTVDSLALSGLSYNTTYYWRVSARSSAGDTSVFPSTPWSFKTIVAVPGSTTLTAPAADAKSQSRSSLAFSWASVTNATTYWLEIATDSIYSTSSIFFSDSTLTSTTKTLGGFDPGTIYYWRVRVKNVAGVSDFTASRAFSTALPLVTVVAPTTTSSNIPVSTTLSWTDSSTVVSYKVQVSTIATFTSFVANATQTADSLVLTGLNNNTKHYWRARGIDANGDTSAYPSTPWSFTTQLATPVLKSPADGSTGQSVTPTLTWSPPAGADSSVVQISNDPLFQGTTLSSRSVRDSSLVIGPLSAGTKYYWRVMAKTAKNTNTSLYSGSCSFTVTVDIPATPTLLTPADKATDQPIAETFTWSAAVNASRYSLQVAQYPDSLFSAPVNDTTFADGTSRTLTGLSYYTRYFWRVVDINASSTARSDYSTTWSFTTVLDTPKTPVPISPALAEQNTSTNPTLKWHSAQYAFTYTVELSKSSTFDTIAATIIGVTDTTATVAGLLNNTQYYWRVRGVNTLATGHVSSLWNFTTIIGSVVQIAPKDDTTGVSQACQFTWNTLSGAAWYRLQVSTDSLFASMLVDDSLVTTTGAVSSLSVSTRYFWRVQAHSAWGGVTNSAVRRLTTVVTTPGITTLKSPADSALNQPVTLSFQWNTAVGALKYRLQIATDSSFNGLVSDDTTIAGTSRTVSALSNLTQYYWRVCAINSLGAGPYSSVWHFSTVIAAPTIPVLALPANGATDLSISPAFNWSLAARAVSYHIQISPTITFATLVADDSTVGTPPRTYGPLAHSTTYFWRVSAKNPGGTSDYSTAWNFTTIADTPATPTLLSPADSMVNLIPAQTLSWNAAARAAVYQLQVALDTTFSNLAFSDSALTATSQAVGPFSAIHGPTRFFWRVRGKNTAGWGGYSSVRTYRTLIDTPTPVYPADGAKNISSLPVFRWNPVANAARYHIQCSASDLFSTLLLNDSTATDTVHGIGRLAGQTTYYWRVSATSADSSSTSLYSTTRSFTTVADTPAVPVIVSPISAATEIPINPVFVWKPSVYSTSYQVQVATDSLFASVVVNNAVVLDTTYTYGPLIGLHKYYWRVRGSNTAVNGPYTATHTFTTAIGTPAIISPANRAVNQPIALTLTWGAVDSASRYRLQFSKDSLFATTLYDDSTITTVTKSFTGLDYLTPYYWRVRAKSAKGSVGAYSATAGFTTVIQPPAVPVAIAPMNAIRNVSQTPQLMWYYTARADSYRVQISTSASFSTAAFDDSTATDTAVVSTALQPLTWYYWHVRAENVGGFSAYTASRLFKTIASAPALTSPADSTEDQAINITLRWAAAMKAYRYHLQVSTYPAFDTLLVNDSTISTTSRALSALSNATTYYWRVATLDTNAANTSEFSTPRMFTTIIAAPDVPVIVSPSTGTKGVSPANVVLLWGKSARAARYRLQVATDTGFTKLVFDDTTLTDTTHSFDSLSSFTKYYWRVRGSNKGGYSVYSSIATFVTTLAVPVLVSPADTVIDQAVSLQFKWNAVTSGKTYRLQIALDSLFGTAVFDDSSLTVTSKTVSTLLHDSTYYWHVRAKASDGTVSGFSAFRHFRTIVDTPAVPVPSFPADRSVDIATAPLLQWLPAARSVTYDLRVATDSLFKASILVDTMMSDTARQLSGLAPTTVYWWKVRGKNHVGYGAYCAAMRFTTVISTPLPATPADSAIDQLQSLTFTWGTSAGATMYRFQLSPDSAFNSYVVNDTVTGVTTRTVTGLLPVTRYYWRVAALSPRSAGTLSASFTFMTTLIAPNTPILIGPSSGIAGLTTIPVLRWHPGFLAAKYHVQVSTDSPFLSTIVDDSTAVDTVKRLDSLQYLTKYYWRVSSLNAKGASAYSSVWSFETVVQAPAEPLLASPASASTGRAVVLTLTWHPSLRADTYHLQVSTDAPFVSTVVDDSTLTDTLKKIGPLDDSKTYYWHVAAKNAGWVTNYSSVWSFKTADPPTAFALLQNYPNPFNPKTVIPYELSSEAVVTITVYDLLGRPVTTLVNQEKRKSGRYTVELDARNMATGMYFCRMTAGTYTAVKKMMVLK